MLLLLLLLPLSAASDRLVGGSLLQPMTLNNLHLMPPVRMVLLPAQCKALPIGQLPGPTELQLLPLPQQPQMGSSEVERRGPSMIWGTVLPSTSMIPTMMWTNMNKARAISTVPRRLPLTTW